MGVSAHKKLVIGSLKVNTRNLGDHIQILACLQMLEQMNLTPTVFIDRDTALANEPPLATYEDRLLLPLNGWFKLMAKQDPQWPPHGKILPIFFGFHLRPHVCPALLERRSLDYLKAYEPIGCRDPFTVELLQDKGISAYLTNCLSLTFPARSPMHEGDTIVVASKDPSILEILPPRYRQNHVYINHYRTLGSFESYMTEARALLDFYKNRAKLVITTFLHCALPCIAMGIPVIVFYPNRQDQFWETSDRQRFSGLKTIAPIYEFREVDQVNWTPSRIDVEEQKAMMSRDFRARMGKALDRF